MPPRVPYQVYGDEMEKLKLGYALFNPDHLVQDGVHFPHAKIGDLGFVDVGGVWHPLFNIHCRPEDQAPGHILPESFEYLPRQGFVEQRLPGAHKYAAKSSQFFQAGVDTDAAGGAITMNGGSYSFSLDSTSSLAYIDHALEYDISDAYRRRYVLYAARNYKQWGAMLATHGLSIDVKQLRLVHGCTLAPVWFTSTSTNRSSSASFGPQISVQGGAASASVSLSYTQTFTSGVIWRAGPPGRLAERQNLDADDLTQTAEEFRPGLPYDADQTLFIRSLRVGTWTKVLAALDSILLAVRSPQQSGGDPRNELTGDNRGETHAAPGYGESNSDHTQSHSGAAVSEESPNSQEDLENAERILDLVESDEIIDARTRILEYILKGSGESGDTVTMAVVHDEDLSPYVNAISDGLDIDSILAETRPRVYTYVADGERVGSLANFDEYSAEDHECGAVFITRDTVPSWTAEQLCQAITSGDTDSALSMLREGAPVNTTARIEGFEDEQTPLGLASHLGQYDIVRLLLLYGAAVNFKDHISLRCASSSGHFQIVQLLLDSGADVSAMDGSLLNMASAHGHHSTVCLLLEHDALRTQVHNGDALLSAVGHGHESIVQTLLNTGVDVNIRDGAALINAAFQGYEVITRLLLDKGASVNARNGEALLAAASKGHEGVVRLLLDNGADVVVSGGLALNSALIEGNLAVVRLLMDKGVKVNDLSRKSIIAASSQDHEARLRRLSEIGFNANAFRSKFLSNAARQGQETIVRLLLDKGTDVNALYGNALSNAAGGGHEAIVRLLLDNGADVNARHGEALYNAAGGGHEAIVRLLLDKGADVNALHGEALRSAVKQGHDAIVHLLLDKGANINALDSNDLLFAANLGSEGIVRLLAEKEAAISTSRAPPTVPPSSRHRRDGKKK